MAQLRTCRRAERFKGLTFRPTTQVQGTARRYSRAVLLRTWNNEIVVARSRPPTPRRPRARCSQFHFRAENTWGRKHLRPENWLRKTGQRPCRLKTAKRLSHRGGASRPSWAWLTVRADLALNPHCHFWPLKTWPSPRLQVRTEADQRCHPSGWNQCLAPVDEDGPWQSCLPKSAP